MELKRPVWLILFGLAAYGFGALSVTADELYGIAQFYGASGVYYFPIIGARGLWDAWVYVFTGLGICFFLGTLSIIMLQRTLSIEKRQTRIGGRPSKESRLESTREGS